MRRSQNRTLAPRRSASVTGPRHPVKATCCAGGCVVRSPGRWLGMQPKSELGGIPFTIKFADVVLTWGPFYHPRRHPNTHTLPHPQNRPIGRAISSSDSILPCQKSVQLLPYFFTDYSQHPAFPMLQSFQRSTTDPKNDGQLPDFVCGLQSLPGLVCHGRKREVFPVVPIEIWKLDTNSEGRSTSVQAQQRQKRAPANHH